MSSTQTEKYYRKRARKGRIMIWLASRASRNSNRLIDRLCRRLMTKAMTLEPEDDFMRDDIIDNDLGFSAAELNAYENSK